MKEKIINDGESATKMYVKEKSLKGKCLVLNGIKLLKRNPDFAVQAGIAVQ